MKPIVIYPNSKDNKITLTKEDFENYLKQAYDTGYSDGYAAAPRYNWQSVPYITTTNTDSKKPFEITWDTTGPNDISGPYKITCDAHNDI